MTDRSSQHGVRSAIDETAEFDSRFRHFHPRLVRYLTRFLSGTSVDPEDVAQESMVKAWTKREQFDPQFQFSTWVYTIARRTAADHIRQQRRHERLNGRDLVAVSTSEKADLGATDESAENLWQIADRVLSCDQYSSLWLRYGEGMTVKEVAKALSKSPVYCCIVPVQRCRPISIQITKTSLL